MDVLFVNHISNGPAFNSGIAALSAFLKVHGMTVSLLNIADHASPDVMKRTVVASDPKVIAFNVHTPHWPSISGHIKTMKALSPAVPIICGGYHPTLCPEEVIAHPNVDVICRGEGEYPLLHFMEHMKMAKDPSSIRGLWVKQKNGNIVRNPVSPPLSLDALPYWDRELFIEAGLAVEGFSLTHIAGMPLASGRGCPYDCSFCNNASILKMYGKTGNDKERYVRKRAVSDVISECRYLIDTYQAEGFEFWDEMFASQQKWLREFCDAYRKNIAKPFICALRVERADENTLQLLYDAGCRCVFFGVETGNETYRKNYLNRRMPNDAIEAAFETARKIGLERFAWVMLGLPDETSELIDETLEFVKKIDPDIVGWSLFHPLPGTALYDYCIQRNYIGERTAAPYQGAPDYQVPLLERQPLSSEDILLYCERFRSLEDEGIRVNK